MITNSIQMQNKNISVKPSFKGVYGFKGDVGELNQALELIKKQGIAFDVLDIEKNCSQKVIGVLTASDINSSSGRVKEFLTHCPQMITDTKQLLEPSDIRGFNFWTGEKRILEKITDKGYEFFREIGISPGKPDYFPIRMINFPEPKTLFRGLYEIYALPEIGEMFFIGNTKAHINSESFDKFVVTKDHEIALDKAEEFAGAKMTGLKGYGRYSTAFSTEKGDVLKISFKPNTPETPKSYDTPVIDRTKIPLNNARGFALFSVLQKNGLNSLETWIKHEDLKTIEKNILAEGDKPDYGANEFHEFQLAKINGNPFLVDSEVIENRKLWVG